MWNRERRRDASALYSTRPWSKIPPLTDFFDFSTTSPKLASSMFPLIMFLPIADVCNAPMGNAWTLCGKSIFALRLRSCGKYFRKYGLSSIIGRNRSYPNSLANSFLIAWNTIMISVLTASP